MTNVNIDSKVALSIDTNAHQTHDYHGIVRFVFEHKLENRSDRVYTASLTVVSINAFVLCLTQSLK